MFQHLGNGSVQVVLLIQHPHALHDHLLRVQRVFQGLLFRLGLGDVKGDLNAGWPAFPFQQPVLEQIMALGDGIGELPGVVFSWHQLGRGAEIAGAVLALQGPITFLSF